MCQSSHAETNALACSSIGLGMEVTKPRLEQRFTRRDHRSFAGQLVFLKVARYCHTGDVVFFEDMHYARINMAIMSVPVAKC